MPQAIIQITFLLRMVAGGNSIISANSGDVLAVASIIQSVVSIVLSILNDDALELTEESMRGWNKKFPPSAKFVRRFMFRLLEVSSRIALLTLLWVLLGGWIFVAILLLDFLWLLIPVFLKEKPEKLSDFFICDILCVKY